MLRSVNLKSLSSFRFGAPAFFFLSAIVTWPLLAELEVFEVFYEFSRDHEDWDLDELALLFFNLLLALMLSLHHKSRTLKKLAREKEIERKRADENASHDPLTGLLNRRAFSKLIDRTAVKKDFGESCVLAMIDLDRFKPVNDLHGHVVGDQVLQHVARILETETPDPSCVARLGGDEFAILFDDSLTPDDAERIVRRMIHVISEPYAFDDGRGMVRIGCSAGLVVWNGRIPSSEAISHADKALYKAKTDGRGHIAWYDAELDRRSTERAVLEDDLRWAIEAEEIRPWFQPVVDIESRRLTGFEVLARWEHSERGQVLADQFIQIAEDLGLINTLGLSILRQACLVANDWSSDLTISVNISPLQFGDANLVENIAAILDACQFDPARLTIEVTESSVILDIEAARSRLTALKDMGISLALDDFGTGYSSLASLRQLPFDRVKIDRSFVSEIGDNPQNQKIVSVILALANGLDLDVTAEGIESATDLAFLESEACGLGQGFLFERALPPENINWLLESVWSDGYVPTPETDAVSDAGAA